MKHFLLPALIFLTVCRTLAQEPVEGKVEYQKKEVPAAVIELPYPPSVVEDAMKDYLYRKGVKGGSAKGFTFFKGTKLSDMNMDNTDVYFKVEKKSRKDKNSSVVYLFATRENEDPALIDQENYDLSQSKDLLREMLPAVESNNLEAEIAGQENSVKRAEKKYESLEDEARSIEKKIKKLEENLEDNRKEQDKQRVEIENQKRILETLRSKKRTGLASN